MREKVIEKYELRNKVVSWLDFGKKKKSILMSTCVLLEKADRDRDSGSF